MHLKFEKAKSQLQIDQKKNQIFYTVVVRLRKALQP